MVNGRRHGDLAERIASEIKKRRRLEAGIDQLPPAALMLPNNSPEAKRSRELAGGTIIVGRPAFKEFMAGLKRGWSESLELADKEEQLANELASDGRFDEVEPDIPDVIIGDGEPIPTVSKLQSSKPFGALAPPHLKIPTQTFSRSQQSDGIPDTLNAAPATIPPQPPILLVSFLNRVGLSQIPAMIWEFFNERQKARAGAEAAYRLIVGETRPFIRPFESSDTITVDSEPAPGQPYQVDATFSDLDFDKDKEAYYKKSVVKSFSADIQKAREEYYAELPKKLEIARALARGTREATKDEQSYPPPTEVQLRAERLKKELRWRSDERGWEIIKPDSPVTWDARFKDILRVFTDPSPEREEAFRPQSTQKPE